MLSHLQKFRASECGAVTTNWIVLTAATGAMALSVMALTNTGVESLSTEIEAELIDRETSLAEFVPQQDTGATAYDGAWLAPGSYDADSAWVAALSDQSLFDIMSGYATYADPANVDLGTHNEPRYHDQYWMAHNEALNRGLEMPAAETSG